MENSIHEEALAIKFVGKGFFYVVGNYYEYLENGNFQF
jgi:hypothetical protein